LTGGNDRTVLFFSFLDSCGHQGIIRSSKPFSAFKINQHPVSHSPLCEACCAAQRLLLLLLPLRVQERFLSSISFAFAGHLFSHWRRKTRFLEVTQTRLLFSLPCTRSSI
jgi:hypothetical protein